MDFIMGLPNVGGKSVIVVIVERQSKYCHLECLPVAYSAVKVGEFFISEVVQLHRILKSIVSDHDKVFLSRFWKELFTRSSTTL